MPCRPLAEAAHLQGSRSGAGQVRCCTCRRHWRRRGGAGRRGPAAVARPRPRRGGGARACQRDRRFSDWPPERRRLLHGGRLHGLPGTLPAAASSNARLLLLRQQSRDDRACGAAPDAAPRRVLQEGPRMRIPRRRRGRRRACRWVGGWEQARPARPPRPPLAGPLPAALSTQTTAPATRGADIAMVVRERREAATRVHAVRRLVPALVDVPPRTWRAATLCVHVGFPVTETPRRHR